MTTRDGRECWQFCVRIACTQSYSSSFSGVSSLVHPKSEAWPGETSVCWSDPLSFSLLKTKKKKGTEDVIYYPRAEKVHTLWGKLTNYTRRTVLHHRMREVTQPLLFLLFHSHKYWFESCKWEGRHRRSRTEEWVSQAVLSVIDSQRVSQRGTTRRRSEDERSQWMGWLVTLQWQTTLTHNKHRDHYSFTVCVFDCPYYYRGLICTNYADCL